MTARVIVTVAVTVIVTVSENAPVTLNFAAVTLRCHQPALLSSVSRRCHKGASTDCVGIQKHHVLHLPLSYSLPLFSSLICRDTVLYPLPPLRAIPLHRYPLIDILCWCCTPSFLSVPGPCIVLPLSSLCFSLMPSPRSSFCAGLPALCAAGTLRASLASRDLPSPLRCTYTSAPEVLGTDMGGMEQ